MKKFLLLLSLLGLTLMTHPSYALNNIHDAGYGIIVKGKNSTGGTVGLGLLLTPNDGSTFAVPLVTTFELTEKLELGGGLKTKWIDAGDNVPHAALGAKYQLDAASTFMADFLLSTSNSSDNALRFGYLVRRGWGSAFSYRGQVLIGFLDGLVKGDAPFAIECAWYPTIRLFGPYSFELGLIGSSQAKKFESNFSLDIQPAFAVNLGGDETFFAGVTMGLAGEEKENLRISFALIHAFK